MKDTRTEKSRFVPAFFFFSIVFIVVFVTVQWVFNSMNVGNTRLAAIIASVVGLLMALSTFTRRKRAFAKIEHGSAKWGEFSDLKPLQDKDSMQNLLFSQNCQMSMNMHKTRRNRHVLVFGGSGSGKSRYYVKPNVMQMNASFVITDPKGEHLKAEGKMLEDNGYVVKVFNVVDFLNSMSFNPLHYFEQVKDIRRFVNMLLHNTTGDTANTQSNEDFWIKAERLWLMAMLSFIKETCSEDENNLNSLMLLLENSQTKEEDEDYKSAVDLLFKDLEHENPRSFAAKQYKKYKLAAGKTAKSILISIAVRLSDFDIPEIADLVATDELELDKVGDRKTALFVIIDDMDTSYNYLVAIMLDVMFNVLKRKADSLPNETLDIPVNCYLDEIANIGKFPTLHIMIAVLRSRGVSLHLIFQNIAQLKAIYKDFWSVIDGNCDTTVFLGGKGEDMTKHVSETLVGNTTIETVSTGGTGSGGTLGFTSYNRNEQAAGRKLIDETEVARLGDNECIVSIRGFNPFKDTKIETEKHKNYKLLRDSNKNNTYDMAAHTGSLNFSSFSYVTEINLEEVV